MTTQPAQFASDTNVTTAPPNGLGAAKAVLFQSSGASGQPTQQCITPLMPLLPGNEYVLQASYLVLPNFNGQVYLQVVWYAQDQVTVIGTTTAGGTDYTGSAASSLAYGTISQTDAVPAGAAYATFAYMCRWRSGTSHGSAYAAFATAPAVPTAVAGQGVLATLSSVPTTLITNAAGSVTLGDSTLMNSYVQAGSGNRVAFSQFENTANPEYGWGSAYTTPSASTFSTVVTAGITYGAVAGVATAANQQINLFNSFVPVTVGESLACSGLIGVNSGYPCTAQLRVNWLNASNATVAYTNIGSSVTSTGAASYQGAIIQVPSSPTGIVSAELVVTATATGAGNIACFMGHPMIIGVSIGQTVVPAFVPGPSAAIGATVGATTGVNLSSGSLGTLSDSQVVTGQGIAYSFSSVGYYGTANTVALGTSGYGGVSGYLSTSNAVAGLVNSNVAVGTGNRIQFSQFEKGQYGWGAAYTTPSASTFNNFTPSPGITYGGVTATATAANQQINIFNSFVPVKQAEYLAVSGLIGATNDQPCTVYLAVNWLDSTGSTIISSTSIGSAVSATGAASLQSAIVQVPSTSTIYNAEIVVTATSTGAGTITCFIGQPMIIGVSAGQTVVPSFVPGPNAQNAADVTANYTAAAIANQSPFATATSIPLGTIGVGGLTGILPLGNTDSATHNAILAASLSTGSGVNVAGSVVTGYVGNATSATSFLNQTAWATYSTYLPAAIATPGYNLIYDAGLSLGGQNWTLANWLVGKGSDVGTYAYTNYPTAASNMRLGGLSSGAYPTYIPVFASTAYTLSWYSGGNAYSGGTVQINWYTSAGVYISQSLQTLSATAGYTRQSLTATSPSNAAYAACYCQGPTQTSGAVFLFFKPKFEIGSTVTAWTDDSTTGATYASGALVDTLKPAQINADQTSLNQAASIPSQSPLATGNSLVASQVTNSNISLGSSGTIIGAGGGAITALDFANVAGSTKPANNATLGSTTGVNLFSGSLGTLGDSQIVTNQGVASGVTGQSSWVLASTAPTVAAVLTPGTNLLQNPTGLLGVQSWTAGSSTFASIPNGQPNAPFLYNNSGSNSTGVSFYQDVVVSPSISYCLQAQIFTGGLTGTGASGRVYITWLNASKSFISYSAIASVAAGTDVFTLVYVDGQSSPSNAAYARIVCDISGSGTWSNTNTWWQKIKFEYGSAHTAYTDDSTSGATYANGALVDTLKPAQANADVTLYNTAAGFTGQGAWATYSGYSPAAIATPGFNLIYDAGLALGGQNWTLGNWLIGYGSDIGFYAYPNVSTVYNMTVMSLRTVFASTAYTFSWYSGGLGYSGGTVQINWYSGTTSSPTFISQATITPSASGTYTRQQITATSPSGATLCSIFFNSPTITGSGSYFVFYKPKFEIGSTMTAWSDDSTNGAVYQSGATIDSLKPAQINADKTSTNTAQGIASQGSLATQNSVAYGSAYVSGFGTLAGQSNVNLAAQVVGSLSTSNAVAGLQNSYVTLGSTGVLNVNGAGNGTITNLPYLNVANVPGVGTNSVINSEFRQGSFGWAQASANVSYSIAAPSGAGYMYSCNMSLTAGALTSTNYETGYQDMLSTGGSWLVTFAPNLYLMPVSTAGQTIFASALMGQKYCTAQLWVLQFDAANNLIAASDFTGATDYASDIYVGNGDPAHYSTVGGLVTVAAARWVGLMVRAAYNPATSSGGAASVYVSRLQLGLLASGQTTLPAYQPGQTNPFADQTAINIASSIASQGTLATKNTVNMASTAAGGITPTGSLPPSVPSGYFTYTSTTTGVTLSWSAFTVYRVDGTSISVSSGSQAVSGLSSGTSYRFYPFLVDSGGTSASVNWAVGGGTAIGSPVIAYAGTGDAYGASLMNAVGRIPLNAVTASTTSSGSGGGSGGGSYCMHPSTPIRTRDHQVLNAGSVYADMWIEGPDGKNSWVQIESVAREKWSKWYAVGVNGMAADAKVTSDHIFYRMSGAEVRAKELRLGDIIRARVNGAVVTTLELTHDPNWLVSIRLKYEPRLHLIGSAGLLSHNGGAKP